MNEHLQELKCGGRPMTKLELLQKRLDFMIDRNDEKQERIDKAIEYIEEKYDYLLGDETFLDHDERIDRKQMLKLIDILKGEE